MSNRPTPGPARLAAAMTLVELMLSIVVTAALMGLLVLLSGTLRRDSADQRTWQLLQTLHEALQRYHAAHAAWPSGPTPEVLRMLLTDSASSDLMENMQLDRLEGPLALRDGYGRQLKYLPTTGSREGCFVSAGPDGQFGNPDAEDAKLSGAAIDNLYSRDAEDPSS